MSAISSLRFAESAFIDESVSIDPSVRSPDRNSKVAQVAALAALPNAPALAEKLSQTLSRWAKPSAAAEVVTLQAATQALRNVFERLGAREPHVGVTALRQVEKQPMETLMLAATMLTVQALGNIAEAQGKALDIMAQAQKAERQREVDELRQQIDKAIEQQHKAKKAGIFGAICDWVVSAVEVVSGVAKIVGGALSGNAMTVAGGVMDLMAGTAGLVKAATETLALIDSAHADKYKAIAATAGKIQLAFEIAGAVVDITSAARNMIVTKVIPKAAKTVLQEGAEHVVAAAVKQGTKAAIENAAKEVTEQVIKAVSKEALDVLGQEAIETIVQNAVKHVAQHAAEKGVEVATKKLTEQIVKEIRRELIKAIVKAATHTVVNVTRGAVGGANHVFSGVIEIEKAKLQKQIDMLILDQQMLQSLFDAYEQAKKDTRKQMKDLIQGQATALEGGSAQMKEAAGIAVQGAASMGHIAAATV